MKTKTAIILTICLIFTFCATTQKNVQKKRQNDPRYQYNRGLFYLNNGQVDEAINFFNRSLSLDSHYYLTYNSLGLAYSMKGDFSQAMGHFQKCLEIQPSFTEAHNNLGSVYQEIGLLDNAEQEFLIASQDKSYSSKELPYYNLARLYLLKERPQEALAYIQKSIQINRRMVLAHNFEGIIYEKLNNFEKAIESYKEALKIAPGDVNISFNLAVVYFKNSEYAKAKEIFEQITPQVKDLVMKEDIEKYLRMINKLTNLDNSKIIQVNFL